LQICCCGTLPLRSKRAFAQTQGPSVPNVQRCGYHPFKILAAAAKKFS
jgi:hypothetical protein